MREDGLGRLGVFLNYDPTDFGIKVVGGSRLEREGKGLNRSGSEK